MRKILPGRVEEGRLTHRGYYSSPPCVPWGAFQFMGPCGTYLTVISSGEGDDGWQHVSCSTEHCCPNWQEMCFVKDAFWNEEEIVFQLHPKKSDYINNHANTTSPDQRERLVPHD